MGTEDQWVQRTRGTVSKEDQRNNGHRGLVGTEDQRNSGNKEQWAQRTRGPEEQSVQRNFLTNSQTNTHRRLDSARNTILIQRMMILIWLR